MVEGDTCWFMQGPDDDSFCSWSARCASYHSFNHAYVPGGSLACTNPSAVTGGTSCGCT